MKDVKRIILLLGIGLIVIILIILYFIGRFKYNKIIEKGIELSNIVNKLDTGIYNYKTGVLYYSTGSVADSSVYFNGEGRIGKSKYGHIIIKIKYNEKYLCKTALGDIEYTKNCDVNDLEITMNKNNAQISFELDKGVNGYKISSKDDFVGDFIKIKNVDENFVINLENTGTYYIWFKDKYGNLSEVIEYKAECLNVNDEEYSNTILYCVGSSVVIDDVNYIVLSDSDGEVNLMREAPLDIKLAHCGSGNSFCYYNNEKDFINYRWSKSYINSYLNDTYYNYLSEKLKDMIVSKEICNNVSGTSGCDNNDGCGGFKKEVIENNDWECESYVESKIRVISFDEYSNLIDNSKVRFNDNFAMINSSNESMKVLSVLSSGEVYTKESAMEKLLVRPVFTIEK